MDAASLVRDPDLKRCTFLRILAGDIDLQSNCKLTSTSTDDKIIIQPRCTGSSECKMVLGDEHDSAGVDGDVHIRGFLPLEFFNSKSVNLKFTIVEKYSP